MSIPDLTHPIAFFITTAILYAVITGRYLLVAGFFYLFFYKWFRKNWIARKLGKRDYTTTQLRREVKWSMISGICFAFMGAILLLLFQQGYTRVYVNIFEYPLWWLPVGLAISLLIDETYYYWVHRWMHQPAVFRKIHKIHHQSTVSSPWTSFTFHPVEGLLLSLPMLITIIFVPLHISVIFIQLTIMTFSSVVNHLDIEIYPDSFAKSKVGRLFIGATHHAHHHKQYKYNFGLYFTFWDKWKKTESPGIRTNS